MRKLRYTLRGARGKQEAGEVSWSPISKTRDRGHPIFCGWPDAGHPPRRNERPLTLSRRPSHVSRRLLSQR